ncbi:MAG: hypothetical protein FWD86_03750, partial [Firmicutes bacterium]|nr:hypothetical protein [Bacillota bacterium]
MNKTKRKLQLAAGIIAAASGGLMALILFINGIITLSTISRWYPGFFTISIFTFFFPFGVSLTTMILGIFFCTSPIKN